MIDFFGLAGKYSGFPVDFVYPSMTSIVPANIALIAGGKNTAEAKKFVQFTLSQPGPGTAARPEDLAPAGSRLLSLRQQDPGRLSRPAGDREASAKVNFNADLSEDRYAVVHSLFDQTITFRLKELQAATQAIHDAEAKLAAKPNTQAADLIRQARALAFTPIVSSSLAGQADFLKVFASNKKEVAVSKQITGLEESWNRKARENYAKAAELAQQAAALIK